MNRSRALTFVTFLAAVHTLGRPVVPQCDPVWLPGDPISTPEGDPHLTAIWDPDGPGPSAAVLVVGGSMAVAHELRVGVATFDGATWTPVGTLADVRALAVHAGELVAADRHAVYRWDGAAWQAIATLPPFGYVGTIGSFQGDLYVGGTFSAIDGVPANNIARWDGSAWSPLGLGMASGVTAMVAHTHQNLPGLYVSDVQLATPTTPARSTLSVWNGSRWAHVTTITGTIAAMAARLGSSAANSYLFVGGQFTSIGGTPAQNVGRYLASTNSWSAVGSPGVVRSLHVRGTGINSYDLYGIVNRHPARWTSGTWVSIGSLPAATYTASLAYHAGRYVRTASNRVESFDGTQWSAVRGAGLDGEVFAVLAQGDDAVIGGSFREISGVAMNGVAVGTSRLWAPLGGGVTGGAGTVHALLRLPNGDLIAGGSFHSSTGGVADGVARWDGTSWLPVGAGTTGTVHALVSLPSGDLIAGGEFAGGVVRWDGSTWTPIGGGIGGAAYALLVTSTGDLVVGGSFWGAGPVAARNIARWTGTTWLPFLTGMDNTVRALFEWPNGDLIAGGEFSTAGGVTAPGLALWNLYGWSAVAPPNVTCYPTRFVMLDNGDLLLGGSFRFYVSPGVVEDHGLAVLRNSRMSPAGVQGTLVRDVAQTPAGDVLVGGDFREAGGHVARNFARRAVTCPATVTAYGAGCGGSGGPNLLHATSLPWIGTVWRARATGMPQQGVAVAVYGFARSSIPLPAVLPQGVSGCTLLATFDLLDPRVPNSGVVDTQLAVPVDLGLVGLPFHHQVVPLETGAAGQLTAVTATNALALVLGAL